MESGLVRRKLDGCGCWPRARSAKLITVTGASKSAIEAVEKAGGLAGGGGSGGIIPCEGLGPYIIKGSKRRRGRNDHGRFHGAGDPMVLLSKTWPRTRAGRLGKPLICATGSSSRSVFDRLSSGRYSGAGIDGWRCSNSWSSRSGDWGMVHVYGGALGRMGIFALGIMPYISASIIVQLMTAMVPSLEQLKKEGEQGRKKINQYTRYGTVGLATIQSYGLAISLQSGDLVTNPGGFFIASCMITLVGGTMFLMWLGEQITARGVGNGISLIILASLRSPSGLAVLCQGRPGRSALPDRGRAGHGDRDNYVVVFGARPAEDSHSISPRQVG